MVEHFQKVNSAFRKVFLIFGNWFLIFGNQKHSLEIKKAFRKGEEHFQKVKYKYLEFKKEFQKSNFISGDCQWENSMESGTDFFDNAGIK